MSNKSNRKREVCNYCHSYTEEELNKHREHCQAYRAVVRKSKPAREENNNNIENINHNSGNVSNYPTLDEGLITFGSGKQDLNNILKKENREIKQNKDVPDIEEEEFDVQIKKNQKIKPYVAKEKNSSTKVSSAGNIINTSNNKGRPGSTLSSPFPKDVKEYDLSEKYVIGNRNQNDTLAIGIINNIGDNNSFLSVIIQAFWNM